MAKEGTVAPKERINIKYVPATGDQQEEVELPLKMVVLGDFKGHTEEASLEDRESINVNKDNFADVLKESNLSVSMTVEDHLSGEEDAELSVNLDIESLSDFTPDNITRNVPELRKLLELRESLVALKGPLGNIPSFRKKLQDLLVDEASRSQLAAELESVLSSDGDSADQPPPDTEH